METPDFLRKQAQTPWTERFLMAGVLGAISTNSQGILAAARSSFCPPNGLHSEARMHLRFWVDPDSTSQPPWPKPTFRGLDHLIFAGLDSQNSILIDLHKRRAIGRLSPAMAADQSRWQTMIFPNLLTLLGPAIGVTGLHCACVVRDGRGLLLTGPSGAGKSTLTLALAQRGFNFLSDDWTYFSRYEGSLRAWGLIPRLKLLPHSAAFFPELADFKPVVSVNGEKAIEIDSCRSLGISRSRSCDPCALVFLERSPKPEFTLKPMPAADAIEQLEENFLADSSEALQPQSEVVRSVVGHGCWQLRYSEPPDAVAHKLANFFASPSMRGKL
jgi:hypothetical protein